MQEPLKLLTKGAWDTRSNTYNGEKIQITVESNNAEGIQPLPHCMRFLRPGHSLEFYGALVMDRLRLEEENEDDGSSGQSSLEPKDVSPAAECDDDASNERTWKC